MQQNPYQEQVNYNVYDVTFYKNEEQLLKQTLKNSQNFFNVFYQTPEIQEVYKNYKNVDSYIIDKDKGPKKTNSSFFNQLISDFNLNQEFLVCFITDSGNKNQILNYMSEKVGFSGSMEVEDKKIKKKPKYKKKKDKPKKNSQNSGFQFNKQTLSTLTQPFQLPSKEYEKKPHTSLLSNPNQVNNGSTIVSNRSKPINIYGQTDSRHSNVYLPQFIEAQGDDPSNETF